MSLPLTPFRWLRSASGHTAFWLGLPLLFYLPTIAGPFAFDDLSLVLKAEQYARGETDRLDLFRFAPTDEAWRELRDRGTFPWWSPAHLRIDFFRPIAEWSFYFDMCLFGRHAIGHRAVSLIWFAAVLICLHRLFLTAGGDSVRAGVATLFFGISQTAAQPATFICNRSDLLVLMGASLAAWSYWSVGERPRKSLAALAAAGFAFALLSKEMAIGLAGVIVLHEVIVRWRRIPLPNGPLRGLISCAIAGMAVIYLAYFLTTHPWLIGLGDNHQELNNLSILARAPRALPLYLSAWTAGFPISILFNAGPAPVALVGAVGVVLAVIVARYLIRTARTDRAMLFFALWAVVFMLLGLMTLTETRVLCVATVGWTYLLSALLTPPADAPVAPPLLRHWLLATSGTVSIICGLASVAIQTRGENQLRDILRSRLAAQDPPLADGNTLIIGEPESGFELILAPERLAFMTGLRRVSVAFLTLPGAAARAQRQDDHTLLLTSATTDLLDQNLFGLSLGQPASRRPGQTFDTRDFTAEIKEVADDGRITALSFRFKEPLAFGRLRFHPRELAAVARGNP